MSWVVIPAIAVLEWGEDEVVWIISDKDDERSEENKQGEEEAADDEVKKWSGWWNGKENAQMMFRFHCFFGSNWGWDNPYSSGIFEPPQKTTFWSK